MPGTIHRGKMYYADLNPVKGSEQGGCRPVLIIQNNIGNFHSPTVIVAAVSGKVYTKANLPTHHIVRAYAGRQDGDPLAIVQPGRPDELAGCVFAFDGAEE